MLSTLFSFRERDFLRESLGATCKCNLQNRIQVNLSDFVRSIQYRERVLCITNRVKQNISKVKDFQSTIVFTLSFAFS